VAATIDDETVAVMLEPIQGVAGVIHASQSFVLGLQSLIKEMGLLLFLVEVQIGMGHTGALFAYQQIGVKPESLRSAKAWAAVYPCLPCWPPNAVARSGYSQKNG
jgi:acetylornithine/N-succinyldiaminopimelate aminotransferase